MGNYVYELEIWKEAHRLTLKVYGITNSFPDNEMFGLTSQFKRAAISITSNMCEGYRARSIKERVRYFNISLCSLEECKYYCCLANDLRYMDDPGFFNEFELLGRRIYAFIHAIEKRND